MFNMGNSSCADAASGWPMDKNRVDLKITNNSTGSVVTFYKKNAYGQKSYKEGYTFTEAESGQSWYAYVQEGTYTINFKPTFFCIKADATVRYSYIEPYTIEANVPTGGVRIKKTIDYDPVTQKENVKRYFYGPMDDLNHSSGDPGRKAIYIDYLITRTGEDPLGVQDFVDIAVLKSSSINSLFNTGNNNIYYKYVTISHGDDNFINGGEEHEFIIHRDGPGVHIYGEGNIDDTPGNNTGWDNGLEKGIKYFKNDDEGDKIIVKEIINNYVTDNRNFDEVKGYRIRKNYGLVYNGDATYECQEADRTKVFYYTKCIAGHNHIWFLNPFGETTCIAQGRDIQTIEIQHPCYEATLPKTVIHHGNLRNLDIVEYTNFSYWHYPENTITIQYDERGLNPVSTTTNYYDDNAEHIKLSRSELITPEGNNVLSKMYYPDDLNITSLIDQHRTGELVKSEKYFNDSKTSTKLINYFDWGNGVILPDYIETSTGDNALEPRIRYYGYNNDGSL